VEEPWVDLGCTLDDATAPYDGTTGGEGVLAAGEAETDQPAPTEDRPSGDGPLLLAAGS
jgi:hypothetical protein